MRNVLLIIANLLKITFRKKGNIFIFLFLPVLGVLVSVGLYGNSQSGPLRVDIADNDKSLISEYIIESLETKGEMIVLNISESEISSKLIKGQIGAAVAIPEGFAEKMLDGNAPKLQVYALGGNETSAWVQNYINITLHNISNMVSASQGDEALFNKMFSQFVDGSLEVKPENLQDKAVNIFITRQSLGFLIFFILLGCTQTAEIMLKEKRNRTYYRICTAPVSSKTYVLSSVSVNMLIVLFQLVLIIFVAMKFFRIDTLVPDYMLMLLLSCYGLAAVSLSMMIIAFSDSSHHASLLSTLVVTPTSMLAGCFWAVDMMPEAMKKASYFMPQRWVLDALEKMQTSNSINDAAINILILLLFAAVFFAIAAYRMSLRKDARQYV